MSRFPNVPSSVAISPTQSDPSANSCFAVPRNSTEPYWNLAVAEPWDPVLQALKKVSRSPKNLGRVAIARDLESGILRGGSQILGRIHACCTNQLCRPAAIPFDDELPRIQTYSALLAIAKQKKALPTEDDLFQRACSLKKFGEPSLDRASDGWLTYCVRDAIAVSQEAVLAALVTELNLGPDGGRNGIRASHVIGRLLSDVDHHNSPLRSLKLLEQDEDVFDFSFRQLFSRISERLSEGSVKQGRHRKISLDEWSAQ